MSSLYSCSVSGRTFFACMNQMRRLHLYNGDNHMANPYTYSHMMTVDVYENVSASLSSDTAGVIYAVITKRASLRALGGMKKKKRKNGRNTFQLFFCDTRQY